VPTDATQVVHLVLYVPVDFVIMRYSLFKLVGVDMATTSVWVYAPVSLLLIALALAITLMTQDFGLVLDVTGGIAGASLYYCVPAALAWYVFTAQHERRMRVVAGLLMLVGVAVVLCTAVAIKAAAV
jgi:hypothetical protein